MKHLKKKFLRAEIVGEEIIKKLDSVPFDEDDIMELKKNKYEGYYGTLRTIENTLIQAFKYKDDSGKIFFIPEPKPIVIYFETGRFFQNSIVEKRKLLFDELNNENVDASKVLAFTFSYFQATSIAAIFIFNAIESFANNLIPKNYKHEKKLKTKTEIYDKIQIQRHVPFDEKIKEVLPDITGRCFHVEFGHKWENIKKLKEFRDEIVHTKAYVKETPNIYEDLFNTSLNFNYSEAMDSVKDFIIIMKKI